MVDEHLESLKGMQMADSGNFFYSKLRTRMLSDERNDSEQLWRLPLRPVWIISTLILLLGINGFMLSQQYRNSNKSRTPSGNSSIQNFAEAYDQTINTSY